MAFFCPGAAHGSAAKKSSKQVSLSQGTSPTTPGPPSLNEKVGGGAKEGGKTNNGEHTITLPHSNAQSMMKKLIVVQKYEPQPGDKGLAVKRGETVLLVRDDGEWMYVKNESGVEGYVPRSHLLSPSRTRTRSRSGTALRQVASNGSVPMHSTRSADQPHKGDAPTVNPRITSPLSQEDCHQHHRHVMSNGHHHHPPRLANEILYDHRYSPSSSSGVASLADPFSPGPSHSLAKDREEEQVQSSSSSLDHSHDSYSSYDQSLDTISQPTLISPLNHIEGGREALSGRRAGVGTRDSGEDLPRSNSSSGQTPVDSRNSSRMTPVQNGTNNVHFVDKTTNHIYSTLEQPTSPPPPPLPPRNMAVFSASQEPEQNVYSQLEHNTGRRVYKTCSQEALVHPSHRHNSYSEGWTRDRKTSAHGLQSGPSRSRSHKEVVEIRHKGQGAVKQPRVTATRVDRHNLTRETKITKFRKTVWGVFVVTHDFDPLDENEIAIRKGEHVSVWNRDDQEWFWVVKHASSTSEEGFVPSGCLREVSTDSKAVKSVDSVCHNSHTPTNTTPVNGSPRLDEGTTDPIRQNTQSQDSRHPNPTHPRPPRPSSGGVNRNNSSRRERRSTESNSQVHRLPTSEPLHIKKDKQLPPSPPSSPPPPYTEFDTNRRFVSLSQQPAEAHHSQPSSHGYGHSMHRTRSQGYVTSRSHTAHYPNSPSTPHGDRRGDGGAFPNEGTLV